MRKGQEKKQEMLLVAERLFCLKGFEATSVQDILDVLGISKGGFYHHFASKEALLECLFARRSEIATENATKALGGLKDPIERLNAIFNHFMPLRFEDKAFMAMLLPLMEKQEGRSMRLGYQEALEHAFLPMLANEIDAARTADVIAPAVGECAPAVLHLLSKCWCEAALHLLACAKKGQEHSTAALLGLLEQYRRMTEVLLDAPYGSVRIIDLKEWDSVSEYLLRQIRLPMHG